MKFLLILAALALPATAWADQCGPVRGKVASHDYIILSLSWAPSYCATSSGKENKQECGPGKQYGFVVHGLWPQYTSGTWPQCCQAVAPVRPSAAVDKVSKVMIGSSLLQHEWTKHGACMTSRQDEYFGQINQVVDRIGLAPALPTPGMDRIKVSELKRNWPVPTQSLTVKCKGKRLKEVHVCLDKALSPIPCPTAEVNNDNCPGTVQLD
jgi:ribonuclease T2